MFHYIAPLATLFVSMISVLSFAFAWPTPAPTKTGDYCLDQASDYLNASFEPAHNFKFVSTYGAFPRQSTLFYAFKSALCAGEFYIQAAVDFESCTAVHYGQVPKLIVGVEATKQCKEFVPPHGHQPIR